MVGPKKTKLRTFYGSPSSRFGAVNSKPMAIVLLSKFKVSFSVECVSWYWVGRSVGLKKKPKKQNHKKCRNRRPWYPRTTLKVNVHIFGLTKYTIYCKKCLMYIFSTFSSLPSDLKWTLTWRREKTTTKAGFFKCLCLLSYQRSNSVF